MGTPYFAVPVLEAMISHGYKPVAVITAPDKPAGRGLKLRYSPVKEKALEYDIPVLQPANLKDPEFISQLTSLRPDLQFVVAFRMLPEIVWNLPPLGTYNLHASLLPQYRGAAPINHAIINGETTTGLTTFRLQHEIDTGDIAFQQSISIGPDETAGDLHDRMLPVGADLVLKTIRAIESGNIQLGKQVAIDEQLMHAPKLSPEFCALNFAEPVQSVHNKIRGLSPYPGATALLRWDEKKLAFKLLKSRMVHLNHPVSDIPGTVFCYVRNHLYVSCSDGWMEVLTLQPAGKNKMTAKDFLNGFNPRGQAVFGRD